MLIIILNIKAVLFILHFDMNVKMTKGIRQICFCVVGSIPVILDKYSAKTYNKTKNAKQYPLSDSTAPISLFQFANICFCHYIYRVFPLYKIVIIL